MDVRLVTMPMEGLTQALSKKLFKGKPFHEMKVLVDCAVVGVAILCSLLLLGSLQGVREGTVISALLVGKAMKPMQRKLIPLLSKRYGWSE